MQVTEMKAMLIGLVIHLLVNIVYSRKVLGHCYAQLTTALLCHIT